MSYLRLAVLFVFVGATACGQMQMLDKISTAPERAVAERAISNVQHGALADLDEIADVSLRQGLRKAIPALQEQLPDDGALKLADVHFVTQLGEPRVRTAELVYAVDSRAEHSVAVVGLRTVGNAKPVLIGLHAKRLTEPLSWTSGFGLTGKGPIHFLMLLAAIAAMAITVASLVRVWRSGRFGRRWLWSVGCLFGLGQLAINWTSGQLSFNPFYVQLFSAGVVKQGMLAPWFVSVGVPGVALYVLLSRRRQPDETVGG
jgi:hypothetical protein